MKVLYIGPTDPYTTSRQFAEALVRLGHTVSLHDPWEALHLHGAGRLRSALHYRSGYRLLQRDAQAWARSLRTRAERPDVVWVDGGELLGAAAVRELRRFDVPVVQKQNDDPTGPREACRWYSLRRALAEYDLLAVHARDEVPAQEYLDLGVRKLLPIVLGYDEVMHRPFDQREQIDRRLRSQVAFVGTWLPGARRDDFVCTLVERGVPLALWGGGWHKAPRWSEVRHLWRGAGVLGRDYAGALQGSEVALGLLDRSNRDLHTHRTNEIPYAGGLLCAMRTAEHDRMFTDGEEAVFWDDAEDCARQCLALLADPQRAERIRLAGMQRVRRNGVGNESIAQQILAALGLVAAPAEARRADAVA